MPVAIVSAIELSTSSSSRSSRTRFVISSSGRSGASGVAPRPVSRTRGRIACLPITWKAMKPQSGRRPDVLILFRARPRRIARTGYARTLREQLLEPLRVVERADHREIQASPVDHVLRDALDVFRSHLVQLGKDLLRIGRFAFQHLSPQAEHDQALGGL